MTNEEIKELGNKLLNEHFSFTFPFAKKTFTEFIDSVIYNQYTYKLSLADIRKVKEYLLNNQEAKNFYETKVQDKKNKLEILNKKYPNFLKRLRAILFGEIYANLNEYFQRFSRRRSRRRIEEFKRYIMVDVLHNDPLLLDNILREHFNLNYVKDIQSLGISKEDLIGLDPEDKNELLQGIDNIIKLHSGDSLQNIYKYLLELDNDDKIGQFYGNIDYDPWNPDIRSAPIVVCKDDDQTYVLIGKFGENHRGVLQRHPDISKKCGDNFNEAYLYGECAYVDPSRSAGKLNSDEAVQILKNDQRIKKVYLSPGRRGGQLKRLAKRI